MQVNFNGENYEVEFTTYETNGNTAILLKQDDQIAYVATVNTDLALGADLVGIKSWSENEGIVSALIDSNILLDEIVYVEPSGYVQILYLPLTDEAVKEVELAKKST